MFTRNKMIFRIIKILSFVSAGLCFSSVAEDYDFLDNFRLSMSIGISSSSLLHCSVVCRLLKEKFCLLNYDSVTRKCFWTSNCSELRTVKGGRTFRRKSYLGKLNVWQPLSTSNFRNTLIIAFYCNGCIADVNFFTIFHGFM